MSRFTKDAKALLEYVGGKENIKAVSHCVTRMRFVLVDEKKASIDKIEDLDSAKGTFTQAGQFQVIIGNNVQEFYNEFIKIAGIEGVSKDTTKNVAKSNQTKLQKAMSNLGEIFAPLIPALICGGLILGFRNVIGEVKLLEHGTKTITDVYQFWAGVNSFLWLIGEAVFHFLPVGIVWSITKKMGTTQILGIVLGITLVSPQLLNAYAVAGTAPADIPFWNFGFAHVQMIGYQAQVIPAIMAGFVLVYLERFFRKISPEAISMIVIPFFSLLLSVIIAHIVVGPIGWMIGDWIANVVYNGLTSSLGWLFAGVFGFLYAPLVITGLHHMTNAIDTQLVAQFNGTILWPMIALSNIAQGSAVLAMIFLQKKNEKAQQISVPAAISCYLGVTEPALFGVNLKYMFPFVCGMVGSSIAAMFSVGTGTMATSIGVGGIPGFLSIIPKYIPYFLIAMAIAIVIPFILTYSIGKKKLTVEQREGKKAIKASVMEKIVACMEGTLLPLEKVQDKVFSSKAMGDGFAIEIKGNKVVAPMNGEIIMTYPTKHAYGLRADSGEEILIHIGMDTVELQGQGFESKVEVGDYVKQGDLIAIIDPQYILEQGKSLVSPVIFTSGEKVELLKEGKEVKLLESEILNIVKG